MQLEQAKNKCIELMEKHNLVDWKFSWIKNKNTRGQCKYKTKEICLSGYCTYRRKEKAVMNTILHEIAHALTGFGHTKEWRETFISIGGNGLTHSNDKLK